MTITLYGIRNCDTVKKARSWLEERKIDYVFHDYRKAGIDRERLERWCRELGWETLLNRSGTTFRKLPDADRESLDVRKATTLMLDQPALIRRPVMDFGVRLVVGFKPEAYADAVRASR